MRDETDDDKNNEPPLRMVLFAVNETYWLAQGEEFLNEMLKGSGYFPTPVTCILFTDGNELQEFIGPDMNVMEFWGINPDVVARLRRDNHLKEIHAHQINPDPDVT
ncbi:MAG: hypothetical protein AAGA87_11070 [Pseudomonadota bacterium]